MKKLILLAIVALSLCGCARIALPTKINGQTVLVSSIINPNNIIVVEGCEYFVISAHASFTYFHKGNCKNPIHPENK